MRHNLVRRLFGQTDRAQAVGLGVAQDQLDRVLDQRHVPNGAGRTQMHDQIGRVALLLKEQQRMAKHLQIGGRVGRGLGGPPKWHLGAEAPRDFGDLVVVGRDDGTGDRRALERMPNRVRDHGFARQIEQVLARDGFRTATRRDQRQHFGLLHRNRPSIFFWTPSACEAKSATATSKLSAPSRSDGLHASPRITQPRKFASSSRKAWLRGNCA